MQITHTTAVDGICNNKECSAYAAGLKAVSIIRHGLIISVVLAYVALLLDYIGDGYKMTAIALTYTVTGIITFFPFKATILLCFEGKYLL